MNEATVIFGLKENVEDVLVDDGLSKIEQGNKETEPGHHFLFHHLYSIAFGV